VLAPLNIINLATNNKAANFNCQSLFTWNLAKIRPPRPEGTKNGILSAFMQVSAKPLMRYMIIKPAILNVEFSFTGKGDI
jgi:hypothetical protein